jgi:hypothetical protein
MKQNIELESIKVKPIDMQHHREELRKALLTSPYWERKQRSKFLFLKGGEEIMKKHKFATMGAALGMFALVAVSIFTLMPKDVAQAKEIAQQSYQAVAALPADQKDVLTQKLSSSPEDVLSEAKNAKDLKKLSYEEAINAYPMLKDGPPGEEVKLQDITFLQYTSPDGQIVLLGIDKNNLPILSLRRVEGENPQGSKKGTTTSVRNEDGTQIVEHGGKKYSLPDSGSSEGPQSVKVEGDEVFIDGQKAAPAAE